MLSAIAHGEDDYAVLDALPAAFAAIDPGRVALYCDIVLDALPEAARNHLEALVRTGTHEYRSDFIAEGKAEGMEKGKAEGEAKGEAKAILKVLRARGIDLPEDA